MNIGNAEKLRKFVRDRGWESEHTLKELSRAIMIEAAELNRMFLWSDAYRKPLNGEHYSDELADIAIYLFYLADNFGIDIDEAVARKIEKNAKKYPV